MENENKEEKPVGCVTYEFFKKDGSLLALKMHADGRTDCTGITGALETISYKEHPDGNRGLSLLYDSHQAIVASQRGDSWILDIHFDRKTGLVYSAEIAMPEFSAGILAWVTAIHGTRSKAAQAFFDRPWKELKESQEQTSVNQRTKYAIQIPPRIA